MTTIDELSDTPKYTIKKVSDLTGVLPVTLRAWENRYQMLTPVRSSNRYRLYSDRDIAIIKWLSGQVASGISISSAVSNLHKNLKEESWPEIIPAWSQHHKVSVTASPGKLSDQLFNLLAQHNEGKAAQLMSVIFSEVDMEVVISDVITPCLVRIGEAWSKGQLSVSTEHFASAFIRSKLFTLFQSLPVTRKGKKIIVGCGPTEEHELGALMIAILLRSRGCLVEFLGQDIYLEDLVDYIKEVEAAVVLLTASTRSAALKLRNAQSLFSTIRKPPLFCYAGFAFTIEPELISQVPGIYLGKSMTAAVMMIQDLIAST